MTKPAPLVCIGLLSVAAIFSALPEVAGADIVRGCRGWIEIQTDRTGPTRLADLDASGRCKRRAQANTCRDRARRRIASCAKAVVDDMSGTSLPLECQSVLTSDTRVNWFHWGGIDSVPFPDEPPSGFDRVARHACCNPRMHMNVVEVTFSYHSRGDRNCSHRQRIFHFDSRSLSSGTLEVNCAAQVARGICGP